MSDRIKVAVLGAGIGLSHIEAYAELSDLYEVVYVCDLDPEKAKVGAALAKGARPVSAVADVFSDPSVDLVDICLPPHLHSTMTIAALDAGKHVVCEKPIAGSVAEVHRIAEAAKRAARQMFPVFQYRYGSGYRAAHTLKEKGMLGKPFVLSLETHWQRGADYYAERWRGSWRGELGGAVVSHAIHAHNLVTLLAGNVRSVAAFLDTRVNPIETEDCAAISMKTVEGALVTSSITLGAAGSKSRFRACFEHVTLTSGSEPYHVGAGPWVFLATDPARQAEFDAVVASVPAVADRFAGQFADIFARLRGMPDLYLPTFADAEHSIELITAIYESAQNSRIVDLPLPRDHALTDGWQPADRM
ncbi:Gfo/Idh/MocA family protein [Peteryoungia ipomoeae]|uniref:Gfo/Idh/MocA family oxidoreductase n=1 Tax=Peteryoungia ipomoeae TaxID=1210932 RepID=A0A4S8NUV9_9HYPH|nr:Gfo/Idh/MocA family oxidoreductase [Peteryoungia ipomoeae]THV20531.1 Gfo/Idh/MocA family oxidoreductase [Peteryoungia ipomoeae]